MCVQNHKTNNRKDLDTADVLREVLHRTCDFRSMGFEREVASVVKMDFCIGVIPPERRHAGRQEERIIFAPDRQQRGSLGAEIFLEPWIKRDITGIVKKQVKLDLVVPLWTSARSRAGTFQALPATRPALHAGIATWWFRA